jgi:inner membrane protein
MRHGEEKHRVTGNLTLRTHRDTPSGSLARLGAHRGAPLGLVAAIALAGNLGREDLPFLPRALVDEPCHLATAMVVLGAFTRWRGRAPSRWFVWVMLSSSVLIDLDHLPLQFGSAALTAGTPRPYTHALWLPAVLAAAAVLADRRFRVSGSAGAARSATMAAGAALGVAAHFLRDVATAPIALGWPLSSAGVQVPASWYLAALLILAILPSPRPGSASLPPSQIPVR